MRASDNCLALIKKFEGFSAKPYLCPAGVPTIGYGSTRDTDGKPISMTHPVITEAQAKALMLATLVTYEGAVNRYVKVPLTQNQFDALVDFAYNAGTKALLTSKLLIKLNAGKYVEASQEFPKWVYAGGKKLPGLVRRREAEKELFLS